MYPGNILFNTNVHLVIEELHTLLWPPPKHNLIQSSQSVTVNIGESYNQYCSFCRPDKVYCPKHRITLVATHFIVALTCFVIGYLNRAFHGGKKISFLDHMFIIHRSGYLT